MTSIKLPDEFLSELSALFDTQEYSQWQIGRHLYDFWSEIGPHYEATGVSRNEWFRAVGREIGRSTSTLRSLHRVYSICGDKGSMYTPPLTYHHIRATCSAGDDWETWANWALDQLKEYGKVSVESIFSAVGQSQRTGDDKITSLVLRLEKALLELHEMTRDYDWIIILSMVEDKKDAKEKE